MNNAIKSCALAGRRILIVEDEFLIADEMAEAFSNQGAEVIGPAATLEQGLSLIESTEALDGAILDINLRGDMVFPLADALAGKRIPYVFATGYDSSAVPERYLDAPRCEKPVDPMEVAAALF